MHLIATNLFVFVDYALSTSENVPSPFLLINRYSKKEMNVSHHDHFTVDFLISAVNLCSQSLKQSASNRLVSSKSSVCLSKESIEGII